MAAAPTAASEAQCSVKTDGSSGDCETTGKTCSKCGTGTEWTNGKCVATYAGALKAWEDERKGIGGASDWAFTCKPITACPSPANVDCSKCSAATPCAIAVDVKDATGKTTGSYTKCTAKVSGVCPVNYEMCTTFRRLNVLG